MFPTFSLCQIFHSQALIIAPFTVRSRVHDSSPLHLVNCDCYKRLTKVVQAAGAGRRVAASLLLAKLSYLPSLRKLRMEVLVLRTSTKLREFVPAHSPNIRSPRFARLCERPIGMGGEMKFGGSLVRARCE